MASSRGFLKLIIHNIYISIHHAIRFAMLLFILLLSLSLLLLSLLLLLLVDIYVLKLLGTKFCEEHVVLFLIYFGFFFQTQLCSLLLVPRGEKVAIEIES